MLSMHEYTPPGTLEDDETTYGSAASQAPNSQPVDSVAALMSWLHSGGPSAAGGQPRKQPMPTKFLALKHSYWRQPYAREVQLRDGIIYTLDPESGEPTNQWKFDDAAFARVEVRGDSAVLWLELPGCWLPRPRRRTRLEIYMPSESLAQRVAAELGFDVTLEFRRTSR